MQMLLNFSFIALKVLLSPRKPLHLFQSVLILWLGTFSLPQRFRTNLFFTHWKCFIHSISSPPSAKKKKKKKAEWHLSSALNGQNLRKFGTFVSMRKWKQSQNNSDLWKEANVRWMGRKWAKPQEVFNEKTIKFKEPPWFPSLRPSGLLLKPIFAPLLRETHKVRQ